jgi:hypothetical protein
MRPSFGSAANGRRVLPLDQAARVVAAGIDDGTIPIACGAYRLGDGKPCCPLGHVYELAGLDYDEQNPPKEIAALGLTEHDCAVVCAVERRSRRGVLRALEGFADAAEAALTVKALAS